MNEWETKIAEAFIGRYFVSVAGAGMEERGSLRLRSVSIFPDFDSAAADEKESYLEAAEALERKGLLNLNWEKRSKGERLKTLACADLGKLFEESGRKDPKAAAEEIRSLFKDKALNLPDLQEHDPRAYKPFLNYLSEHFGPAEIGRGMDQKATEDFIRLLELFLSPDGTIRRDPSGSRSLTTRALSISLYSDSKRLEYLLDLFGPLLSRIHKKGIPTPYLSFLKRSFPETMIAGNLIFEYDDDANGSRPPLVNSGGLILGFPLRSVREIRNIRTIAAKEAPKVLTIENKETFYALSNREENISQMDSFLYVGGYLNRTAAAMIKTMAASGFHIYHAGDLDPDGILILQNIMDITGKPVTPVGMNAAVFDRYLPWARPLAGTMFHQLKKIREDTKMIPGLADLIRRIVETRRGVEQEIIDYRRRDLNS